MSVPSSIEAEQDFVRLPNHVGHDRLGDVPDVQGREEGIVQVEDLRRQPEALAVDGGVAVGNQREQEAPRHRARQPGAVGDLGRGAVGDHDQDAPPLRPGQQAAAGPGQRLAVDVLAQQAGAEQQAEAGAGAAPGGVGGYAAGRRAAQGRRAARRVPRRRRWRRRSSRRR
jgi:hypothetical protein